MQKQILPKLIFGTLFSVIFFSIVWVSNFDYSQPNISLDEEPIFDSAATSDTLPNILLILADDMGHNDIGYYSTDIKGLSPFIDSIAGKGILLSNYYTQVFFF